MRQPPWLEDAPEDEEEAVGVERNHLGYVVIGQGSEDHSSVNGAGEVGCEIRGVYEWSVEYTWRGGPNGGSCGRKTGERAPLRPVCMLQERPERYIKKAQ